ncbi:MAG TPA: HPF/RaiA family ribosome-associated protein [Blastocatellia bacterium]|nr:HPF/RaiA family ribosome-associated protein [Blastocatellia bacterium]
MILPVQVSFRNMPRSDAIEAMVREEAAHLDRYYNHIMGCRVMIEVPHRHREEGEHHHVRIYLTVPGGEIVVKREPSLHSRKRDVQEEELTKDSEIERSHKHVQVAIREAFDTVRRRLQDYARRQRLDVKTHEGQPYARVCRLYPEEGYAYIETIDGREVYFHKNSVLGDDFKHVKVGSEVTFVEEEGEHGPQASSVKLVGRHRRHRTVSQKAQV